jgi:UDP-N-acetylmuramate--alanine ligase
MRLQSDIRNWFAGKPTLPPTGRVHFVGIGGAGMSALARILLHRSREVSGSDLVDTRTTGALREMGADIQIGHAPGIVDGAAAVVISDAVDFDNVEIERAKGLSIPLIRRSQLLGQLLQGQRVFAVTGSHGKSTATAMLAQILAGAGYDPLAVVGADVPGFAGNVRLGSGGIAVVEACEAYDSFHDIVPDTVLLTNLEPEHLDYHGTWEHLRDSVIRFVESAKGKTKLVYCADDSGASEVAAALGLGIPYGGANALDADRMRALGAHNALNGRGAVEMAKIAGVREEAAIPLVESAVGCVRRLEFVGEARGVTVYDDYAHHPTEIRASIRALKDKYPGRLIVVFQPHLYSRARDQLDNFAPAFREADFVVVTDIYAAREKPLPGISSALIIERLEAQGTPCAYVASRHWLPREVADMAAPGDVVVGMGAGNIDAFASDFLAELNRPSELRVAVLAGGDSAEREVSLLSGTMVAEALQSAGKSVVVLDPTELLAAGDLRVLTGPERPDIAFLALHGTGFEDGRIQGLLELLRIPYTGSGLASSALAMDKERTKLLLAEAGLPVPPAKSVPRGAEVPAFEGKCVVKPNQQGSTIGLSVVERAKDLTAAVERAWKYDEVALVEQYIDGVEISVPVVGTEALPAVEICPLSGSYDFASKYTPGATEEIVPARISKADAQIASDYALRAHTIVGAADFSRTDMIVADKIYVLEVNTIPGMTSTSLLPRSAESIGISYQALCERVLGLALKRYGIAKN